MISPFPGKFLCSWQSCTQKDLQTTGKYNRNISVFDLGKWHIYEAPSQTAAYLSAPEQKRIEFPDCPSVSCSLYVTPILWVTLSKPLKPDKPSLLCGHFFSLALVDEDFKASRVYTLGLFKSVTEEFSSIGLLLLSNQAHLLWSQKLIGDS